MYLPYVLEATNTEIIYDEYCLKFHCYFLSRLNWAFAVKDSVSASLRFLLMQA